MRRHVVTLCLLFPLISLAQSQRAGGPPPPFAHKSWVGVLLEHRQELALTEAQISDMERINKALEEKDAPLKQSLEQLRPQGPGPMGRGMGGPPSDLKGGGDSTANRPSQEEMRSRFEQAHKLMEQLRANNDASYTEAQSLLSDAQKKTAQEIVNAEAAEREQRRQEMHQRMRDRMGSGGGSL